MLAIAHMHLYTQPVHGHMMQGRGTFMHAI